LTEVTYLHSNKTAVAEQGTQSPDRKSSVLAESQ
jgi:hypothetical protein